jgi:hypothetical protein
MGQRIRFDSFVSSIRWSFFEKFKERFNLPKMNEITTESELNKVLCSADVSFDDMTTIVYFAVGIEDYMYELAYFMLLVEFGELNSGSCKKTEASFDHKIIYSILDEIRVSVKYREGGGEGGPEDCHTIFEVGGKLYKIKYSYYSYQGFEIDDGAELIEVVPKTIEVVAYVEV